MQRSMKTWNQGIIVIVVTAVLGLVLSLLAAQFVAHQQAERTQHRFVSVADTYTEAIQNSIERHLRALRVLGSSFVIASELTPDTFRLLANSLLHHHTGFQRVQWLPQVLKSRSEGISKGAASFPILYSIAHRDGDDHSHILESEAVGSDPSADPAVRALLNKAGDDGTLVMSIADFPTMVVYLPIYQLAMVDTTAWRRAALQGFIRNEFKLSNLVKHGILGVFKKPSGLNVAIHSISGGSCFTNIVLGFRVLTARKIRV